MTGSTRGRVGAGDKRQDSCQLSVISTRWCLCKRDGWRRRVGLHDRSDNAGVLVVPHRYDAYQPNVMAGPQRLWMFKNDPAHEWMLQR